VTVDDLDDKISSEKEMENPGDAAMDDRGTESGEEEDVLYTVEEVTVREKFHSVLKESHVKQVRDDSHHDNPNKHNLATSDHNCHPEMCQHS